MGSRHHMHCHELGSLTFHKLILRLQMNSRDVLLLFVTTCSFSTLLPKLSSERPHYKAKRALPSCQLVNSKDPTTQTCEIWVGKHNNKRSRAVLGKRLRKQFPFQGPWLAFAYIGPLGSKRVTTVIAALAPASREGGLRTPHTQ